MRSQLLALVVFLLAGAHAVTHSAAGQELTVGDRVIADYQQRLSETTRQAIIAKALTEDAQKRIAELEKLCGEPCKKKPDADR